MWSVLSHYHWYPARLLLYYIVVWRTVCRLRKHFYNQNVIGFLKVPTYITNIHVLSDKQFGESIIVSVNKIKTWIHKSHRLTCNTLDFENCYLVFVLLKVLSNSVLFALLSNLMDELFIYGNVSTYKILLYLCLGVHLFDC